ncbi:hypothetical protein EAF00_004093 [Botryotinia globosa]|nr:hypothetical protein EAF00_004093 [Botryotinia globosa]
MKTLPLENDPVSQIGCIKSSKVNKLTKHTTIPGYPVKSSVLSPHSSLLSPPSSVLSPQSSVLTPYPMPILDISVQQPLTQDEYTYYHSFFGP